MRVETSLQKSLQEDITVTNRSISIYGAGKVTDIVLAEGFVTIKKAFPKLSSGWYDALEECLDEAGFTDKRFAESIKSLVMNCQYPEPTIANITGFDRRVKLYNYSDFLKETASYSPESRKQWMEDHPQVKVKGERYFIAKSDCENYKHLFEE